MLYRTKLHASTSSTTVLARVQAVTDPEPDLQTRFKSAFRTSARPGEKPFVGRVEGSSFKLLRRIYYRNSFRPQIRGAVSDVPGGAQVDLTMSVSPVVVIFLLVWCTMAGGIASIALPVLVIAALGIAILSIVFGSFFFEVRKARRLLEKAIRT